MNSILVDKITQLKNAQDYECWYLVKHSTDFCNLCYIVEALKEQQLTKKYSNVEKAVDAKISQINTEKSLTLSNNYRALRVAAFFGLIKMTNSKYDDAIITSVFDEIKIKCNGDFEKKDLYQDIIDRQIEKLFVSSSIDEGKTGVRSDFAIYPIMFLYKILSEIGKSTGSYSITNVEYAYLVATTRKYEDFLDTMLLIKLCRNESSAETQLRAFDRKFDNRMNKAIELLSCLDCSNGHIAIKSGYEKYVAEKVFAYENGDYLFSDADYISFLCSSKKIAEVDEEEKEAEGNKMVQIDESKRVKGGRNIILYGVPGAGKSYTIETEYCKDEEKMERLVFHPDYTYSDFVGQILPSIDESGESKSIQYKFEPGPFTTLLKKAYRDPENKYYLIIEEINRGNAPAIFGDVFQLLDRKPDGTSMYGITNTDIAKIVYDDSNHKVRIPSNMSILCTMNTSDQNVFTLDTAFQRRWNMRLIENTFRDNDALANVKILDTTVTWKAFQETINEIILNTNVRLTSAEDKRLGTHFVVEEDLFYNEKADKGAGQEQIDARLENRRFAEKVIKYLWDDAFKFNRESLFNVRDNGTNNSLEAIIKSFLGAKGDARFDIFLDNIKRTMIDESQLKDEATGDADGTSETN